MKRRYVLTDKRLIEILEYRIGEKKVDIDYFKMRLQVSRKYLGQLRRFLTTVRRRKK